MSDYVDIHAHVIPGVDDGPATLEDSIELVRTAGASGTVTLAATSHLRSDFPDVRADEIAERLAPVIEATKDLGVRIVPAGEVSLTWALEASAEQRQLVSFRQAGADLLIETPMSGLVGIDHGLYELRAAGYRITLAHPERGIRLDSDFGRLETLAGQGILLQVNAQSLLSSAGPIRKLAQRLCRDGLASVIASDGHSGTQRRPITVLPEGIAELRKLVGEERTHWMSSVVPAAIVDGERVGYGPVVEAKRGFLRRR